MIHLDLDTITLSGYAGTGKTTIMKFLHAYLEAQGNPPVYAAPTIKLRSNC